MQDTAQPKTPAVKRTWALTVTYRECGVVTDVRDYTVTLDKRSGKLLAEVNGQSAEPEQAVRLLRNADTEPTVISEVLTQVAA